MPGTGRTRIYAYEKDPYLTRLDVEVVCSGREGKHYFAVTSDTILYPEGGGQPADRGTLAGAAVCDVQRKDGEIRHYLKAPVEEGEALIELDWPRRFDHMQQHTAQHLLSALVFREFGWETTSFHLGAEQSDIELDTQQISPDQMGRLEDRMAAEIRAARPVRSYRVSPQTYSSMRIRSRGLPEGHEGDVRIVEIEGIDQTTCGGTHVASTAELESVALPGTIPMRGGTRLFFLAGARLRRRLASQEQVLAELRQLLGVSDSQLVQMQQARTQELAELRRREKFLQQELARLTARLLAASKDALVAEHFEAQEMGFLQAVARSLLQLAPGKAAFLTAGAPHGILFVLAAGPESGLEVKSAGAQAARLLGGRGGGSGEIFQGKAGRLKGSREVLKALRDQLKEKSGARKGKGIEV